MNQNYAGYGGQQGIPQQQQQMQPGMMNPQQNMFQSQQQLMAPQNQQQMMNTQTQQQMLNVQRNQAEYMQQRMQPGAPRPPYLQVRLILTYFYQGKSHPITDNNLIFHF